MAEPSAVARIYPAKDGSGLFFGDYCNWSRFAEYADFLRHSALAETTAQLMGAHCTGIESVYYLRRKMGLSRHTCVVGTIGATFDLKDGIKTGRIAR